MGNTLNCGGFNGSRSNSPGPSQIGKKEPDENVKEKEDKEEKVRWNSSQFCQLGSMSLPTCLPNILIAGIGSESQLCSIREAAKRLSLTCTVVNTTEEAQSEYRRCSHQLVIMETVRSSSFDPCQVTKTIRNCTGGEFVVVVGIVSKYKMEREELCVEPLLDMGIDRVLTESDSRVNWTNELVQLIRGPFNTALRLRSTQSLFCALDNCRDIVQITDNQNKVTWINQTAEKILGYSPDEILGKDIRDFQTTSSSDISTGQLADTHNGDNHDVDQWFTSKLREGKVWEGPINCKRKTGDYVPLASRVAPVSFSSNRTTDQIIYVKDPPPLLRDKILSDSAARINTFRTASLDVTSIISEANSGSFLRRPSSNKLPSISIEAPITKVINIILAAQENQPSYIAQALDKVLDILKTSGSPDLFSPELETEMKKHRDPVTTDLLGALLAKGVSAPRRLSHDRTIPTVSIISHTEKQSIQAAPTKIRQLLSNCGSWDFDILQLELLTDKRPLVWLGMSTLVKFDVARILGVEETVLHNWLTLIEANYHSQNEYHNSSHAADVMQATAYFLEKEKVKCMLDQLDIVICLIGAIIHDVDHPGRNSAYLCNSGSDLAILYNDITVLENHHSALGFKLTHSDSRVNIFQNLQADTYKAVRQGVIDVVLATDMSKHFVHVNKFCATFGSEGEIGMVQEGEMETVIKRMLIKCADVSNPARPLELCKVWAARIAEEYFSQTDDEKAAGLPVVMPQFDRTTCSIPQSQIGFYDFFIHDMFQGWNDFADCPELTNNIESNYAYWQHQLEQEEQNKDILKFEEIEVETNKDELEDHEESEEKDDQFKEE